jgi:hypothetical protein
MKFMSNKIRSSFQYRSHRSYKRRFNSNRKRDENKNKSNYNIRIFILKHQLK